MQLMYIQYVNAFKVSNSRAGEDFSGFLGQR